jgi:hypothetical protein
MGELELLLDNELGLCVAYRIAYGFLSKCLGARLLTSWPMRE